jgi:hypothetical protein
MIWGCCSLTHGESAKPLDRAAEVTQFDCFVCVFVVVFCVWEQLLATLLVESLHWLRQNGKLLQTHRLKSAPKDPKY